MWVVWARARLGTQTETHTGRICACVWRGALEAHIVAQQELGILAREDIIRDARDVVFVAEPDAELAYQRSLPAAHGATNPDSEAAVVERPRQGTLAVAKLPCRHHRSNRDRIRGTAAPARQKLVRGGARGERVSTGAVVAVAVATGLALSDHRRARGVDAADGGCGRACGRNPAAQKPEHRGQRCLATTACSGTSAALAVRRARWRARAPRRGSARSQPSSSDLIAKYKLHLLLLLYYNKYPYGS